MKDLAGKVAVVTGAASGIGLALAHAFGDEGMKVVLADVESEPLAAAEAALRAKHVETLAVRTDVASESDVDHLADAAFETFGGVHLLCNNAGVGASGATLRMWAWEASLADWEWTLRVNFWGVLHGVRAFVPRMLAAGTEGHIVNTASMGGLVSGANPYYVSKHAVVCLTEGMYKDFRSMGARLSASVLCPAIVRTRILEAERNRPREFGPVTDVSTLRPELREWLAGFERARDDALDPAEVAQAVVEAVRTDRFYVFVSQPSYLEAARVRMQDIIEGRNPTLPS